MWKIRGRSGVGSDLGVFGRLSESQVCGRQCAARRRRWPPIHPQLLANVAANPAPGRLSSSGCGPRLADLASSYYPCPPLSTAFIDSTAWPDASFVGAAFCFCSGVPTTKGMENVRPTVAPPIVVVTATVM
jgi:hypothetical protein